METKPAESCFLNRNTKDFGDPNRKWDDLARADCCRRFITESKATDKAGD
jgi:hypothetical protein